MKTLLDRKVFSFCKTSYAALTALQGYGAYTLYKKYINLNMQPRKTKIKLSCSDFRSWKTNVNLTCEQNMFNLILSL